MIPLGRGPYGSAFSDSPALMERRPSVAASRPNCHSAVGLIDLLQEYSVLALGCVRFPYNFALSDLASGGRAMGTLIMRVASLMCRRLLYPRRLLQVERAVWVNILEQWLPAEECRVQQACSGYVIPLEFRYFAIRTLPLRIA